MPANAYEQVCKIIWLNGMYEELKINVRGSEAVDTFRKVYGSTITDVEKRTDCTIREQQGFGKCKGRVYQIFSVKVVAVCIQEKVENCMQYSWNCKRHTLE